MNRFFALALFALLPAFSFAAPVDSLTDEEAASLHYLDSVDQKIAYQHGTVKLRDFATMNVPAGFKLMPQKEAQWLIESIWGNPAQPNVMGMLVRDNYKISDAGAWTFVLSWDGSGYVKDDDAADLNYDEMLTEMQKSEVEENKERVQAGFPPVHTIKWASKPFYDDKNKVLHWAKDLQFGDASAEHTLNYDVRVLGRKGVLSMNAVGELSQLEDIKAAIPTVIHAATFTKGNQYAEFDPEVDQVAAYTVGGLIAGKILAKVGFFALILKNIKLIGIALVAGFAALRKRLAGLFGRRRREDEISDEGQPAMIPVATETPQPESQLP